MSEVIREVWEEGREEGRKEEREKSKIEFAKELLKDGTFSVDKISKISHLPLEKVRSLASSESLI